MTHSSPAREQFARHYTEHIDEIYRFLFFSVGQQKEIAEDLANQTFLNAWAQMKHFDSAKSSLRTYLFRIARNLLIDYYRKQKSESLPEEDVISDPHQGHFTESIDVGLFWNTALQILPTDAYELLILKYRNDCSLHEMSDITGKTIDAMKSSLKRSRACLQDYFTDIQRV